MRRSLGLHAALVGLVLLAGLAVVGVDGVVSADEGAMLAQLDLLDRTGEWTAPNPEPGVDPDMRALPLELSERSDRGRWAPFAKHPGHIVLLLPAWVIGGQTGVLLVSLAGVVVAAVMAALLAQQLRPGTGPAVLWLTGLGSPLLFDGFQVVGHAMGAGAFGVAAVLALRAEASSTSARRLAAAAGAAVAVALTSLIRSEGVLAGIALGGALAVAGILRRRPSTLITGAACAIAAAAVRFGEPVLTRRALGGSSIGTVALKSSETGSFLSERWSGFRVTVLDAGYGVDAGEPLLLIALVCGVAAMLVWRLRGDESLFRVLAVVAAALAVGRLLTADFLVPGLLPALPLLAIAAAIVLVDRDAVSRWPAAALWGAAGLFVAAVVATQYSTGGTGEWGGRYFAIALPVLVACSTTVALGAVESMEHRSRQVGAACVAVVAGTLAIGAVHASADARDASSTVADAVIRELDRLDVDATVSTRGAISRFAWKDVVGERRWLETSRAELGGITEQLAHSGAERLALVTSDPEEDLGVIDGWRAEGLTDVSGSTTVIFLTR